MGLHCRYQQPEFKYLFDANVLKPKTQAITCCRIILDAISRFCQNHFINQNNFLFSLLSIVMFERHPTNLKLAKLRTICRKH